MAGKGDKDRTTDRKAFDSNWDFYKRHTSTVKGKPRKVKVWQKEAR